MKTLFSVPIIWPVSQSIFLKFKNKPRACPFLHSVLMWHQQVLFSLSVLFLSSFHSLQPAPHPSHKCVLNASSATLRPWGCPLPSLIWARLPGQQMSPTAQSWSRKSATSSVHFPSSNPACSLLFLFKGIWHANQRFWGLGNLEVPIMIHLKWCKVDRSWNTEVFVSKTEAVNQNQTRIT